MSQNDGVLQSSCFHRPEYARLSQLTNIFQNLPLMALTATAPPRVLKQILNVVPDAVMSKGSVNQPNITYRVFERVKDGKGKYTQSVLLLAIIYR